MLSFAWPVFRIRLGWTLLSAVGLQAVALYAGIGHIDYLLPSLFIVSYLLLFGFVWANRCHLGVSIIGIGLLLNFLVMVANGGLMPTSPNTLVRAGLAQQLPQLEAGEPIRHTKDILLERENTNMWVLSDILVVDNPFGIRTFSVGDTVIGAGLVVTLAQLLLRVLKGPPLSAMSTEIKR